MLLTPAKPGLNDYQSCARIMIFTKKHIKFRGAWIILQSLTREMFNRDNKENQIWQEIYTMLLLMAVSFLNQLLTGDQKDHDVISYLKIH